jgi:NADH-quinone oxidoreductase subunit M
VSHGLTVTALFFVVYLLELRRGTRLLDDTVGGLWKSMPLIGSLLLTVIFASIGLPGLSGFPGEFTMLVGIFRQSSAAAVFATLGIVLGAWYLLSLFRKAFAGPLVRAENRGLPDLRRREAAVLLPLVVLMFVIGILPNLILQPTQATVDGLLSQAEERLTWHPSLRGGRQAAEAPPRVLAVAISGYDRAVGQGQAGDCFGPNDGPRNDRSWCFASLAMTGSGASHALPGRPGGE